MALADLHRIIIATALQAARSAGFRDVALGGGNALIVRAGSLRATHDVDLFCRKPADLPALAAVVIEALEAAGYSVERREDAEGWWADDEEEQDEDSGQLVELVVSTADGEAEAEVQIAYFDYTEDGLVPGLGPVLSRDDLAGWKTTTIANRAAVRDYVDYALLRRWYTMERLFELAAERDPGLTPADYADAAVRLDRLDDKDLDPYLAPGQDAADVRAAFAGWPRGTRRDA